MVFSISELADKLKEVPSAVENGCFFSDFVTHQELYSSRRLGERKVSRIIGSEVIPKQGAIISVDNDYYSAQNEKFKQEYPELDIDRNAGVIDFVNDVQLKEGKVELTIERYLIEENS